MDLIPDTIIIVFLLVIATYFIIVNIEHNRWQLDKYDALYYFSNKFFKKQGYEICKIDLVDKSDYKGKTHIHSPFLQEEQFVRKVIIMDSERRKYETIIKVKRSKLFGTNVKLIEKRNYTD